MFESEIKINQFMAQYCRLLVVDIPAERMAEQPLPGVNHPAWILGHLAISADHAAHLCGHPKVLPEAWGPLFGPGSQLSTSMSDYPEKSELVRAFKESYERVRQLTGEANQELMMRPNTNARLSGSLPRVQDALAFLLTGHLGLHLGQLSAWRRMVGFAPLF